MIRLPDDNNENTMPRPVMTALCLLFPLAIGIGLAKLLEKYPFRLTTKDGKQMDGVACKTAGDYLKFSNLAYTNKNIGKYLETGKGFHLRSNWLPDVKILKIPINNLYIS